MLTQGDIHVKYVANFVGAQQVLEIIWIDITRSDDFYFFKDFPHKITILNFLDIDKVLTWMF